MNLYVFDSNENLIHILNNNNLMKVNHIEKTSGENNLYVIIPDNIAASIDVIEGNYFAFYDLDNDFIMFEILKIEEEESSQGILKNCYCENVFYELRDNIIEDQRIEQAVAISAVNAALTGSRWSVGVIDTFGVYTQNLYYQSSLAALADIKSRWQFSDANGIKQSGLFKFRLVLTGNVITGRLVDYKQQLGVYRGKRAVIGKDITSIKRTTDNSELITAAYGQGKGEEIQTDNEAYKVDQDQQGNKTFDKRINFASAIWRNNFPTFTNSGFEDGLNQWTVAGGTVAIATDRYYRGSQSAKLTDTAILFPTTLQTGIYTVAAGQTIESYLWVNTPTTIGVLQKGVIVHYYYYIGAVYQSEAMGELKPIQPNRWEKLSLSAVVPASINGVRFVITTSATVEIGDLYIDEFHPTFPVNKPLNQQWVEDTIAKTAFGRAGGTLNRMGFYYDDEEQNPANLLQKTWNYIQQNNMPKITYEAKILDLENLLNYEHEKMRIGDLIYLLDENFKIPIDVSATIIEMDRDYLLPENTNVTLGNFLEDTADINRRQEDIARRVAARQDIWDRSSAFETSKSGTRMRMITQDGELQSVIKYEDDSTPPNLIGYFSPEEFSYKRIRSDEFLGQNIINVVKTPIDYYVDSYAGDDFNTGAIGSPYKTISRLTSNGTIPKVLYENVTVHVLDTHPSGAGNAPYNEDANFQGILGNGILYFNFANGVILNGSLLFDNCQAWVYIQGAALSQYGYINATSTTLEPLRVNNCSFVYTTYMWYNSNGKSDYALNSNSSKVTLKNSVFERSQIAGIVATNSSALSITNCRGTQTSTGSHGFRSLESTIFTSISVPTGQAGVSARFNGGIISPSTQTGETPTVGLGTPTGGTTPPLQVTVSTSASSTKSWRYNYQYYRTDNDYVYQGAWGYGNHIGIIFWNGTTKFSTIAAAATTIKSAVLYVKRRNEGGYSTAQKVRLYGHDRLTAPSTWSNTYLKRDYGEIFTIKWGEELAIAMPAQFLLDVNSGLIAGLAIYQSAESPYVILEGKNEYNIRLIFKYV